MSETTDQIRSNARNVSQEAWRETPHEQHATCHQIEQTEQLIHAVCALVGAIEGASDAK